MIPAAENPGANSSGEKRVENLHFGLVLEVSLKTVRKLNFIFSVSPKQANDGIKQTWLWNFKLSLLDAYCSSSRPLKVWGWAVRSPALPARLRAVLWYQWGLHASAVSAGRTVLVCGHQRARGPGHKETRTAPSLRYVWGLEKEKRVHLLCSFTRSSLCASLSFFLEKSKGVGGNNLIVIVEMWCKCQPLSFGASPAGVCERPTLVCGKCRKRKGANKHHCLVDPCMLQIQARPVHLPSPNTSSTVGILSLERNLKDQFPSRLWQILTFKNWDPKTSLGLKATF